MAINLTDTLKGQPIDKHDPLYYKIEAMVDELYDEGYLIKGDIIHLSLWYKEERDEPQP